MGCCFSSRKASRSAMAVKKKKKTKYPQPKSGARRSREAPAMVEEENVKEVLSETPTPKPPPLTTAIAQLRREIQTQKLTLEKMKEKKVIRERLPIKEAGKKYEISKICSLSDRLSREKMEENEDSRKKINISPGKMIKNHTFSGVIEAKKDWYVNKSPNRRPYQSPGRSYTGGGSIKIVQSRDSNLSQTMRGLRSDQQRRDHCEKSTRRSKSPATNRSDNGATRPAAGRSPSVRRGERSPSRSAASPPYAARKNRKEGDLKEKTRAANESLANPLVSLECFIFL